MKGLIRVIVFMLALPIGGCASLPESLISPPNVSLRGVEIVGLGFKNQTFLLSFDVDNPNAFALPIKHIAYAIRLNGQRFASGETASDLSIGANGSSEFAISVDLDLLSTAPDLLGIVREAVDEDIPYQLDGEFGLDLPLIPAVRYENSGVVRLDGAAASFLGR